MAREGSRTYAIAHSLGRSEASVRVKMRALRSSGELVENNNPYRRRSKGEVRLLLEGYVLGDTHAEIAKAIGRSVQSVQRGLNTYRRPWHRKLRRQIATMREQGADKGAIALTVRDRFKENEDADADDRL